MEDYTYFILFNGKETETIEPIGWDTFESKLVRNEDYHGISAEYSDLTVKFFDPVAMNIIKAAYEDDIDNVVTFISKYKGVEEYRGQLDFGVYKEGFEMSRYIQVTITELDVRVKFNNRFETKVDLNSLTAFDGALLPEYPHLDYSIILPAKGIEMIGDTNLEEIVNINFTKSTQSPYTFAIPFGNVNINEISTLTPKNQFTQYEVEPVYNLDTVFTNEFDIESALQCSDGEYTIDISGYFTLNLVGGRRPETLTIDLVLYVIHPDNSWDRMIDQSIFYSDDLQDLSLFDLSKIAPLPVELNQGDKVSVVLLLSGSGWNLQLPAQFVLTTSMTSFKISALSLCQSTQADVAFLHEAFSRITESVTNGEVTVKSELYSRVDSDINPTEGTNTFVIANGLRIRRYEDTEGNKPILSTSFKDLLEGFIPIHNIGYGFLREEDKLYLHIENYEWFYKNDVILSINNPNKKIRSLVPKEVFSNFKIGYKKYETNGTNGLDSIMSEREYRTRQILTDTKLEKISNLVSDSYAIEYTRRRANDKNTENWMYDNDMFVINVFKLFNAIYYPVIGSIESNNLISPSTLYNTAISPARCAMNWLGRLFGWSNKKEELIFTSGTGNINASIKRQGEINPIVENQNFPSEYPVFKSETIEVPEYPLKPAEYRMIRDNPYGIIEVDGEKCYIKEIKYKRKSSIASFILLPKISLDLIEVFIFEMSKLGITVDRILLRQLYDNIDSIIKEKAKVILFPVAVASGVVYAMDNSTGKPVPFRFSRASSATMFDSNKNLQLVNNDMPRIDYGNYADSAKLLIEKESTNLVLDSTFELGLNQLGAGFTIEDSNWLNFIPKKAVIVKGTTTNFYYKNYTENNPTTNYIFSSFLYSEENPPVLNQQNTSSIGTNTGNGWNLGKQNPSVLIKDNIWFITRNIQSNASTGNKNIGWVKYLAQNDTPLEAAAYQLELGDIATSYIPTTDTAATRAADLLTYNLPSASQVYIKTTKQETTLNKPSGVWNIHEDLNNEGIEVLAVL